MKDHRAACDQPPVLCYSHILRRRLRERRLRSLGVESVRIIGGVDIPMAHGRIVTTGLAPAATGLVFRVLAFLPTALGLGLLAALPFMGRRRIRIDPDGLLIDELRVPWATSTRPASWST